MKAMNPNNCETCQHKQCADGGMHATHWVAGIEHVGRADGGLWYAARRNGYGGVMSQDLLNCVVSSSGPEFVKTWAQVCLDHKRAERAWIAKLRSQGVKAAHPGDGWVDRVSNTMQFVYPQFNDNAGAGDVVALGWPDRYRLVTLTQFRRGSFGGAYWLFAQFRKEVVE